jgi:hypothetical protein
VGVLVNVKDALAFSCVLSDHIVVHLHDLLDSAYLEWQSVRLRELLEDRTKLWIVVAGHGREQVVLQLVLHSSEQVLSDKIVAADSTCALEIVSDVTVRSICVDKFFCLMIAGDHDSNHKASY